MNLLLSKSLIVTVLSALYMHGNKAFVKYASYFYFIQKCLLLCKSILFCLFEKGFGNRIFFSVYIDNYFPFRRAYEILRRIWIWDYHFLQSCRWTYSNISKVVRSIFFYLGLNFLFYLDSTPSKKSVLVYTFLNF